MVERSGTPATWVGVTRVPRSTSGRLTLQEGTTEHFPDVRKMIIAGKGAERDVDDILLTRYACYLKYYLLLFCPLCSLELDGIRA